MSKVRILLHPLKMHNCNKFRFAKPQAFFSKQLAFGKNASCFLNRENGYSIQSHKLNSVGSTPTSVKINKIKKLFINSFHFIDFFFYHFDKPCWFKNLNIMPLSQNPTRNFRYLSSGKL